MNIKRISSVVSSIDGQTVYKVPANTSTVILSVTATNTSLEPRLISAFVVPSGSTAGDSNIVSKQVPINVDSSVFVSELIGSVMNENEELQFIVDNTENVNINLSIKEIV